MVAAPALGPSVNVSREQRPAGVTRHGPVRRRAAVKLLAVAAGLLLSVTVRAEMHYLIVGSIGGEPDYTERFADQVESLAAAARRTLGGDARVHVLSGETATRDALRERLAQLADATVPADRLAVFLLGHGSYDGEQYKFNLSGPDIDDAELAVLLDTIPARTQLIVNATSASGAALERWAADGRTLITATRSGAERNATRFGEYWADALSSADADINKNGTISAQEAFDFASRMVESSFEDEGALATEHPQLAGDGAAAFEVARLTARRLDTPQLTGLNEQLSDIEGQIAALRLRREELGDDYLPQLQALLVQLSLVQQQIDAAEAE